MITVEQWENGLKIPDDIFRPVFWYRGIIIYFVGEKTGIKISRDFGDILL